MKTFIQEGFMETWTTNFYKQIKKIKLKTSPMTKVAYQTPWTNQIISVKAQSKLIRRLMLIIQSRKAVLKEVFFHRLGLRRWPLRTITGGFRKTVKVTLLHGLENGVQPITIIWLNLEPLLTCRLRLGKLAKHLLMNALVVENNSSRISSWISSF